MRIYLLAFAAVAALLLSGVHAYYNITFINDTVILNSNTSAHVIETFTLHISNASAQDYLKNRDAIGLSLSDWEKIIYTTDLRQHILSPVHSAYSFTFLPGPLISTLNGSQALFTMSYYLDNVTSVKEIAPRIFGYAFNDSVFNFENEASGQTLPYNTRLNIIIPADASAVSLYPLPDSPPPTFINNYYNFTSFSWFSGEPLSQFSFSFTIRQSLQAEVLSYFSGIYNNYADQLYLIFIVAIVFILAYLYLRTGSKK